MLTRPFEAQRVGDDTPLWRTIYDAAAFTFMEALVGFVVGLSQGDPVAGALIGTAAGILLALDKGKPGEAYVLGGQITVIESARGTADSVGGNLAEVLVLFAAGLAGHALWMFLAALADADRERGGEGRITAIFGLVGAINIPIIHYSVTWWNSLHQPPSITTGSGSGRFDTEGTSARRSAMRRPG